MSKIKSMVQRTALIAVTASALLIGVTGPASASAQTPSADRAPAVAAAAVSHNGVMYEAFYNRDGSVTVQPVKDDGSQAVEARWSRTIKFNNRQTKQIHEAAAIGATGVISGLCVVAAPAIVDPFCTVIAGLLVYIVRALSAPGDNDCLGVTVTTRVGIPPVRVRAGYVNCN